MPYEYLDDVRLPRDPQVALDAATKQYVDNKVTGAIDDVFVGPGNPPTNQELWIDTDAPSASGGGGLDQGTADGLYVNVTGDTMTGQLNAPYFASPTEDVLLGFSGGKAVFANKAWTGNVPVEVDDPTAAKHAATKQYVDQYPTRPSYGGNTNQAIPVASGGTFTDILTSSKGGADAGSFGATGFTVPRKGFWRFRLEFITWNSPFTGAMILTVGDAGDARTASWYCASGRYAGGIATYDGIFTAGTAITAKVQHTHTSAVTFGALYLYASQESGGS